MPSMRRAEAFSSWTLSQVPAVARSRSHPSASDAASQCRIAAATPASKSPPAPMARRASKARLRCTMAMFSEGRSESLPPLFEPPSAPPNRCSATASHAWATSESRVPEPTALHASPKRRLVAEATLAAEATVAAALPAAAADDRSAAVRHRCRAQARAASRWSAGSGGAALRLSVWKNFAAAAKSEEAPRTAFPLAAPSSAAAHFTSALAISQRLAVAEKQPC
mmetsp:Transcript_17670/g.61079  ORF Transcript_17670/g.61079 Transcript_17670/m.61079 type:complete len:224 (-) Transcript_17670:582-1253(-)